jgi:hypothetical protein
MLGFDYELRRQGFAGNSCQIVLELSTAIKVARLEQRLADLAEQHPILRSQPGRGLNLMPRWKPTRARPRVRVHEAAGDMPQRLFNEPLHIHRGELMRFDLIERTMIFTWAHALMDAKSAEYFLALVGGDGVPVPEAGKDWYAERMTGGLRALARQAWQEIERLDQFRKALPVSLATHRGPVETGQVVGQASRLSHRASRPRWWLRGRDALLTGGTPAPLPDQLPFSNHGADGAPCAPLSAGGTGANSLKVNPSTFALRAYTVKWKYLATLL